MKTKGENMPKKKKVCTIATMSVLDGGHRMRGLPDPENANILEGISVFEALLTRLQQKGVVPGTKIKIIIEEL